MIKATWPVTFKEGFEESTAGYTSRCMVFVSWKGVVKALVSIWSVMLTVDFSVEYGR